MKVKLFFLLGIVMCCTAKGQQKIRLQNDWEFVKQDLGGIWEAVRPVKPGNPEDVPYWTKVTLPHCVNAEWLGRFKKEYITSRGSGLACSMQWYFSGLMREQRPRRYGSTCKDFGRFTKD